MNKVLSFMATTRLGMAALTLVFVGFAYMTAPTYVPQYAPVIGGFSGGFAMVVLGPVWIERVGLALLRMIGRTAKLLTLTLRLGDSRLGRIAKPPGYRLARIMKFILTTKAYERIVMQIILDEQEEHAQAVANGLKWKARFINVRLWAIVVTSLFATVCASAISKLFPRPPSL